MRGFFRFFAERHLLANLLTFMVLIIGLISALRINRSQFPKIDFGAMTVSTYYPGASPEDVELNVTNKLEDKLKGLSGIQKITSASIENVSTISIEIDPNAKDQAFVKNKIREAVSRVTDLPEEVTENPRIDEMSSSTFVIIEVGISGEGLPYGDLRKYALLFEKKLSNVPGVSSLLRYGYRAREIRIEVIPDRLIQYKISLQDIITAIQRRNIRASGGTLESYTSKKNVVTLARFESPLEVGEVIIRSIPRGGILRLKDLAVITDGFEEERVISRTNGKTSISFGVLKDEQADIIQTIDRIKALVEEEKSRLPQDTKIEFLYTMDESRLVRNKLNIVFSNAVIGLGLVLGVLSIFLNIRSSIWVAMGIPFSILGGIIFLPLFDVDLDSITLSSMVLVIGIIVDDAIVISENIHQKREKGFSPLDAVVSGIQEVYMPVLTSVATTILAFVPMFFMKGMVGKFVFVIPLTVTLALLMSLCEASLILPAHLLPGLRKSSKGESQTPKPSRFAPLQNAFERFVRLFLPLRYVWVLVGVLCLSAAFWYAASFMKFIMFPGKGADVFNGLLELPRGSSLEATLDRVKELEAILDSVPKEELNSYRIRVGLGHDIEVEHNADIDAFLTPYSTRTRTAEEIVEDIRRQVAQLSGIQSFSFYVATGGPPTGKPVEMNIIGSDDASRTQLTDEIFAFLSTVDGIKDLERSDRAGKEEVVIRVNHERLAHYGLTVADIAQNVRIAYDGEIVTSIREGEEDVKFRVMLDPTYRQRLDYLKSLRIPNQKGELIAIDEVASLVISQAPSLIQHDDGERAITISGDVFQDKITPTEVMDAVLERFGSHHYPGIQLKIGGEAEASQDALLDLVVTFGIAALGIYCLLAILFNSLTQPLLVIISIPFGLCGVIVAFALHGEPFSFIGMMGVIGMAGVVVNNCLVLIDHLNSLTHQGESLDIIATVAVGTANRLRPILVTSITTVVGLLPLAYGLGGYDVYIAPMALALGYGIVFATPFTLVLIPCLYVIMDDLRKIVFKK